MAKANYSFDVHVKITHKMVMEALNGISEILDDEHHVKIKATALWDRQDIQALVVQHLARRASESALEIYTHDLYHDINLDKLFKAEIKAAWEKIEAEEAADRAREEAEYEKQQRNMPKNLQVPPEDYRKAVELLDKAGIKVKPLSAHPDWPFPVVRP